VAAVEPEARVASVDPEAMGAQADWEAPAEKAAQAGWAAPEAPAGWEAPEGLEEQVAQVEWAAPAAPVGPGAQAELAGQAETEERGELEAVSTSQPLAAIWKILGTTLSWVKQERVAHWAQQDPQAEQAEPEQQAEPEPLEPLDQPDPQAEPGAQGQQEAQGVFLPQGQPAGREDLDQQEHWEPAEPQEAREVPVRREPPGWMPQRYLPSTGPELERREALAAAQAWPRSMCSRSRRSR